MVTSYTLTAFSVQKRLEPSPTLSSVVCLSDRYDLVSVLAGETFGALKSRILYKLRRLLIIMTNYFERQEFVRRKSRLSYPYLSLFVNAQVRKCSSLRSFLFNGNYAITCTVSWPNNSFTGRCWAILWSVQDIFQAAWWIADTGI